MNRKNIEEFIKKNNLFFDEFVVYKHTKDPLDLNFFAREIESCSSGFYPTGEEIKLVDCLCDVEYALHRYDGVLFCDGWISLCDDTWDGYQPEVTFEDFYELPNNNNDPLAGLEDIF